MKSLSSFLSEAVTDEWSDKIFTIIKPGFLNHSQDIITMFDRAGWKLDKSTIKTLTIGEAKELYKVHKDKDFYEDLCNYMSSGPSRAIIYKRCAKLQIKTEYYIVLLENIMFL